jgi:hypothetical protein
MVGANAEWQLVLTAAENLGIDDQVVPDFRTRTKAPRQEIPNSWVHYGVTMGLPASGVPRWTSR